MSVPKIGNKVRKVREALREKAEELLAMYLEVVMEARAAGEHQVALESIKWLMDHIPEEDGERVFDPSVDKTKQVETGQSGPRIQIGIALGGVNQKSLPEVTTVESD
jgi:hypothetical protein